MSEATGTAQYEVRAVELTVRPLRLAYLVPPDASCAQLLAAIEHASLYWGGWGHILVPWADEATPPFFLSLLRAHSPDAVLGDPDLCAQCEVTIGKYTDTMRFDLSGTGWGSPFDWPYDHHLQLISGLPGYCATATHVHTADGPAALKLLVAGLAGWMHEDRRRDATVEAVGDDAQGIRTALGLCLQPQQARNARPRPQEGTLFGAGLEGLGLYWGRRHGLTPSSERTAEFVVVGSTVADFCLFYDLLHHGPPIRVWWLPVSSQLGVAEADASDGPPDDWTRGYWRALSWQLDLPPSGWHRTIASASMGETEARGWWSAAESIADFRGTDRSDGEPGPHWQAADTGLAGYRSLIKEDQHHSLPRRELAIFRHSGPACTVTQAMPALQTETDELIKWVTDVSIEDHAFPSRRSVHDLVVEDSLDWGFARGRVTADGAAFAATPDLQSAGADLEARLASIRLRLPCAWDVAKAIFEEEALAIRPSAAGAYAREAMVLFGGLQAFAEALRDSARRKVIDRLTAPNAGRPKDVRKLAACTDIKRWVCETGAARSEGKQLALDLLSEWLQKGVLHRGVKHQCDRCSYWGWYLLEQMGEYIRCTRCRNDIHLSPDSEWRFTLNEVVGQAIDHHCDVPVLTIDHLRRQAPRRFEFVIDVEVSDAAGWKVSPDIVCFREGQLIIGEAKSANKLEQKQAQRYEELADRIRPHLLVFATAQTDWGQGAKQAIEALRCRVARFGTDVQDLTSDQILT